MSFISGYTHISQPVRLPEILNIFHINQRICWYKYSFSLVCKNSAYICSDAVWDSVKSCSIGIIYLCRFIILALFENSLISSITPLFELQDNIYQFLSLFPITWLYWVCCVIQCVTEGWSDVIIGMKVEVALPKSESIFDEVVYWIANVIRIAGWVSEWHISHHFSCIHTEDFAKSKKDSIV